MSQKILSITQINEYIRATMDRDPMLGNVAVQGEISNYKMYPSGHHYFTLKDESAALKCVMFKGNAMRLRFRPENGMKVIAMGKVFIARDKKAAAKAAAAKADISVASVAEVTAPVAEVPAPGTAGQLKLYDTPPKTAAMIMAIVADKMGKPLNELRFISIKEVK